MTNKTKLNLEQIVFVDEIKCKIIAMLGKETSDPNEDDWYEVEYPDGITSHCPIREIELQQFTK